MQRADRPARLRAWPGIGAPASRSPLPPAAERSSRRWRSVIHNTIDPARASTQHRARRRHPLQRRDVRTRWRRQIAAFAARGRDSTPTFPARSTRAVPRHRYSPDRTGLGASERQLVLSEADPIGSSDHMSASNARAPAGGGDATARPAGTTTLGTGQCQRLLEQASPRRAGRVPARSARHSAV